MTHIINDQDLYFFLTRKDGRYYTLTLAPLTEELTHSLVCRTDDEAVVVSSKIGDNKFFAIVHGPVYLLDRKKTEALVYARDLEKLELCPSGNVADWEDFEPIIDYPTYWTNGIEPMLEWKFEGNFFHQINGNWIPLEL